MVEVLMVICTSVLFTKLTSPEVRVFEPPVHVTAAVGGLAKPVPLMEMVCKLLDPVTGFGLTPLMCGGAAGATTGKPNALET